MKQLLLIMLLVVAAAAQAVTIHEDPAPSLTDVFINHGQTTLDTTTDLEWLNFSNLNAGNNDLMTMGYSINSSIETYAVHGFRLATETELVNLFSLIFPTFSDNAGIGKMTVAEGNGDSDLIQARNSWLLAFGTDASNDDAWTTISGNGVSTAVTITGGLLSSLGMYIDDDGVVQYAGILLDIANTETSIYGPAFRTGYELTEESSFGNAGVFMVRVIPLPAAVWLFGAGLIGLVLVARRK